MLAKAMSVLAAICLQHAVVFQWLRELLVQLVNITKCDVVTIQKVQRHGMRAYWQEGLNKMV